MSIDGAFRGWSSDEIPGHSQAKEVSRDEPKVVMLRFCCTSHPSPIFEARDKVLDKWRYIAFRANETWNTLRDVTDSRRIYKQAF